MSKRVKKHVKNIDKNVDKSTQLCYYISVEKKHIRRNKKMRNKQYFNQMVRYYLESVIVGSRDMSNLYLGCLEGFVAAQEFDEWIDLSKQIKDIIELAYDMRLELIKRHLYK